MLALLSEKLSNLFYIGSDFMSIYKKYCHEVFDEVGNLEKFTLDFPENFNFGYDVIDTIAEETPDKTALVWCNTQDEEHIFTFADVKKYSNRIANVLKKSGLQKGDRVMVILKRHYEYWFVAVALHKLGVTMIPATHMLTVNDVVYRLNAANVKAVICTPQNRVPQKMRSATGKTELGCTHNTKLRIFLTYLPMHIVGLKRVRLQ